MAVSNSSVYKNAHTVDDQGHDMGLKRDKNVTYLYKLKKIKSFM